MAGCMNPIPHFNALTRKNDHWPHGTFNVECKSLGSCFGFMMFGLTASRMYDHLPSISGYADWPSRAWVTSDDTGHPIRQLTRHHNWYQTVCIHCCPVEFQIHRYWHWIRWYVTISRAGSAELHWPWSLQSLQTVSSLSTWNSIALTKWQNVSGSALHEI